MPDLGLPKHSNQRLTAKQEDFCRKFMELRSASEAYRASYSAENSKKETVHRCATALLDNPKVAARLDELRSQAEKFTEITMGEVAGYLRRAFKVADEDRQSGNMSTAANGLAKLGALIVDQQRVENVDANEAHLEALRELAAAPVTPPAPAPAPAPVVPPAAEPPQILDITPESDATVRH
jgi:phage terminase small subunit